MISNLHYITQQTEKFSHAELAEMACKGGVNWVQLRVKQNLSGFPQKDVGAFNNEWKQIALETQAVCKKYHATFIINDNVLLAKEIGADGVHLGKEDMSIEKARIILGKDFIIGGTANTIADIQKNIGAGADYIGLGPFRFTSTKEKLSPVIGLEGIRKIMNALPFWEGRGGIIPVIAIGGITTQDIPELLKAGVHGIAVSSAINLAENKTAAANAFVKTIQGSLSTDK